jgi:hypothetical protein
MSQSKLRHTKRKSKENTSRWKLAVKNPSWQRRDASRYRFKQIEVCRISTSALVDRIENSRVVTGHKAWQGEFLYKKKLRFFYFFSSTTMEFENLIKITLLNTNCKTKTHEQTINIDEKLE